MKYETISTSCTIVDAFLYFLLIICTLFFVFFQLPLEELVEVGVPKHFHMWPFER
jgi:hypothetical protein